MKELPVDVALEFYRKGIAEEDLGKADFVFSYPPRIRPEVLDLLKNTKVKALMAKASSAVVDLDASAIRLEFKGFRLNISTDGKNVFMLLSDNDKHAATGVAGDVDTALTLLYNKLEEEVDAFAKSVKELEDAAQWFSEHWKNYTVDTHGLEWERTSLGILKNALSMLKDVINGA